MAEKEGMSKGLQILLAIVLILGIFYLGPMVWTGLTSMSVAQPPAPSTAAACAAAGGTWSAVTSMCTLKSTSQTQIVGCPSGLATLNVFSATKNPLSATADYVAANITIVGGTATGSDEFGSVYAALTTDTATPGTTLAYRTTAVGCVASLFTTGVRIVDTGTDSLTGYITDPQLLSSGATSFAPVLIPAPRGSNLTITIRDTSYANTTITGTLPTAVENTVRVMTTGDTATMYIDLQTNSSSAQFGSTQFGLIFAIDTNQSAAWADKDVALSSTDPGNYPVTEIPCPARLVSFDSANRCYKGPAITNQMGIVRLKETFTASLGNPTSGPITYIEDVEPYTDTDGSIHIGCFDAGATNVGLIQHYFKPGVS